MRKPECSRAAQKLALETDGDIDSMQEPITREVSTQACLGPSESDSFTLGAAKDRIIFLT